MNDRETGLPAEGDPDPVLLDGGADAAALLLRSYDTVARTFALPKGGELWEAVAMAHALGRRGAGVRVAVIDAGFDRSIPELAELPHLSAAVVGEGAAAGAGAGAGAAGASAAAGGGGGAEAVVTHGTAVALLVREVAPEAEVLLCSAAEDGVLRTELIVTAIREAVERGTDVISLSLGIPFRRATRSRALDGSPGDVGPQGTAPDDWRVLYRPDDSPLARAARDAVEAGVTVVVAVGNSVDHVYTPASTPGVAAVGFHLVERHLDDHGRMEEAISQPPSYGQAVATDLLVVQPRDVVGSSFACPLVAGFTTLMRDRTELAAFLLAIRRGATGSELMTHLDEGAVGADALRLVEGFFRQAWANLPHHHTAADGPCPDCALLAAPVYVDFGTFLLGAGDLDAAEDHLAAARAFAPANPHAAANLGVLHAARADRSVRAGDLDAARHELDVAQRHLTVAVRLRPEDPRVAARLAEVTAARADPARWTITR